MCWQGATQAGTATGPGYRARSPARYIVTDLTYPTYASGLVLNFLPFPARVMILFVTRSGRTCFRIFPRGVS